MYAAAYAVILAGGPGSRLWPLSRSGHPKPFLKLRNRRSLLQATQGRLRGVIPPSRTLVVTGARMAALVAAELPRLPDSNLLAEPVGRNTAAGIGLAAIHALRRDPAAVLAVFPADHFVAREEAFRAILKAALVWAGETGDIVTLGVPPDRPETGYGYLRRGERRGKAGAFPVHRVAAFVEKPDVKRAKRYVASGEYAWNSGIFILSARVALEQMRRRLPALHRGLLRIERAIGTRAEESVLRRVFPRLPAVSIDYGIMEDAAREGLVVSLPCRVGWSDIGDFGAIAELLMSRQAGGHFVVGTHIGVDSSNLIVYAPEKLVATVGVEDLIIVHVGEATLICPRDQAQEVRKIVDRLKHGRLRKFL